MGCRVSADPFYTLKGEAADIETIIRLRSWMEDEVKQTHGDFNKSSLITDYDQKREIFEFQIQFFR
jgi:hypothetical protein